MAHRRQRSRPLLANIVALLATVSTSSALSLSNFQVITSNEIPKNCIKAYQTEIEGCTRSDFRGERKCSADCVQGLHEVMDIVSDACEGLNVPKRSLLGIVLSGDLIDTLCPGADVTTVTQTVKPSSTKGFSTINPAPTVTPSSSSSSSKASSSSSKTSSGKPSSTESTTDSETSTPTPSPSATNSDSSTGATSTESTAQPTATQSPPADNNQDDDDDPLPFFGTPFDPVPIRSMGVSTWSGYGREALIGAIFAALLLSR